MKTVLSVGSGSKKTFMPEYFKDYTLKTLDINPDVNPDICMDARDLINWKGEKFDAVYSSHNLEHFRHHDVIKVLDGMYHVLKDEGFLLLIVPNAYGVIEWMIDNNKDLDAVVYEVPRGVVTVRDMIWGHAGNVRITPDEWYLHKTGFSPRLLAHAIYDSGFKGTLMKHSEKEIITVATKQERDNFNDFVIKLPD